MFECFQDFELHLSYPVKMREIETELGKTKQSGVNKNIFLGSLSREIFLTVSALCLRVTNSTEQKIAFNEEFRYLYCLCWLICRSTYLKELLWLSRRQHSQDSEYFLGNVS